MNLISCPYNRDGLNCEVLSRYAAENARLKKVVDTLAKTCERLSSRELDYAGWCEVFGHTADQWREAVEKVVADE